MADYTIGLTGLDVAQRALEIVGNNMANAQTEGYHRQEARITSVPGVSVEGLVIGLGAELADVERVVDTLLEGQIRSQRPDLGGVEQELATLESLESLIGDLSANGLSGAMSGFFGALQELAANPSSPALRQAAVWSADNLVAQFRAVGNSVDQLMRQVVLKADTTAEEINGLTARIAELNGQIAAAAPGDTPNSNLLDKRDQALMELADLADVEHIEGAGNSYTVMLWGSVAVFRNRATEIETDYIAPDTIGFALKGASNLDGTVRGGRMGGLFALRNDILPRVRDEIDAIAAEIVRSVNRFHVQGVGTAGSFRRLDGWTMPDTLLADWDAPVEAGDLRVRVVDTATGQATRTAVAIDPATQTLSDVAASLSGVDHLTASVAGGALHLEAETGYTFDFLPALAPEPATTTLTGAAEPTLSGVYEGEANETFTFTVSGTGEVGVTSGLAVEVRNASGELVQTLDVGQGYAAGDRLAVSDGIYVAFSAGSLNAGEDFTAEGVADSDPTGLLAAAGVNALFAGDSAANMVLTEAVRLDSGRLATSLDDGTADNLNVARMAALADEPLDALDGATPGDAHRRLVTSVGQWITLRRARKEGLQDILSHLASRREEVSGVDVNEEAAKMLVFEQMFQAMAKYLTTVRQAQETLFELV